MENRKYIQEEGINSMADGSGKITAHWLQGENTTIFFKGSSQGPQRINGHTCNRMTLIINFKDVGLEMSFKFKDTHGGIQGLLVQYALDVMEDDTYEEYYKTILLLAKNDLEKIIASGSEWLNKYYRGEHAWPITSKNVNEYEHYNATYKKAFDTIDVTTKDLKYFAQYEREGLQKDHKQYDY